MSINEQNQISKYTPESYRDEKTYNDIPCEEGEVLIPIVVMNNDMIKAMGINRSNMKTARMKNGSRVPVAYAPIKLEHFDNALKIYYKDVNIYLNQFKSDSDVLSLEEMMENMNNENIKGNDPTGIPSHEEKLMLIETLEELIDVVYQRNEKYGNILKLIYQDVTISKQEIIEKLGMKKTQGYEAIKKAHALAKEVYKELNQ
ncbi:TPA: hypothetical protein U4R04_002191 [Streptococcus agalactiae]|jgi:hypothetical protein|uniref:Uncharacterized protein n=1 Tax=Streptococcus anginosus DORA_7 TaxID=1403946 RepID=W1TXU2_STRAP|nr:MULTISPECIES: hypothetical protein [Streptococcus]ETI84143.1 MAG: hypothetical protein Q615_SPAC00131G0020 [Streptococcus anginosus DORA_7]HEQ4835955.1 hypothetical protein [Streptococcus pyogenes]MBS6902594.1 hypothetical protein [Streptococcus anginosus]MCW0946146.1 hypothetical protein [Streptococcus anginosus]MCW1007666.1 hypothetical protein [Streptococcus anginosus]